METMDSQLLPAFCLAGAEQKKNGTGSCYGSHGLGNAWSFCQPAADKLYENK